MAFGQESKDFIGELAQKHYCIVENALSIDLVRELRKCALSASLRPARVGKTTTAAPLIRNDQIGWINENDLSASERELFTLFEQLRVQLNRELFLGLKDFEAHYARYDAGHFYRPHVDRFRDDDKRTISVVVYLNEDWRSGDGGELRLLVDPPVLVEPKAKTLVMFTSADIEHEVLESRRERLSIAAWFRG